jgi:hypothetical protein
VTALEDQLSSASVGHSLRDRPLKFHESRHNLEHPPSTYSRLSRCVSV